MEENEIAESDNDKKKGKGFTINMASLVVMMIWMIICFVYAVNNRSLDDYIKYGRYIFGSLSCISGLVYIVYIIIAKITASEMRNALGVLLALHIPFLLVSVEYYSIFVTLKDTFLWIKSPTFLGNGKVICTVLLTLLLGLGLFFFRLKFRALYGLTESMVGLIVATNKLPAQTEDLLNTEFYLAILTASLYLVVRGFDNIHQGLTKEPKDSLALKLIGFLKQKIE